MKQGKTSTLMPSKTDVAQLAQGEKTINDYGKVTPVTQQTDPVLIRNLQNG